MSGAERPPHAVLVRSPEKFSAQAVASVLAGRAGVHPQDFVVAARRGWGIVAESLPAEQAESLAADLAATGQPALAAPTSLLETPAPAVAVKKADLAGDGFDVVAGREGAAPERFAWGRLAALCAASLEVRATKTVTESDPAAMAKRAVRLGLTLATGIPLGLGRTEAKKTVETRDRSLIVELVFLEPSRRLRVAAHDFDFSVLGPRMGYGAELNFAVLLEELASRAPRALRGRGTRALLARRPAAESLYESLDDLEREERWLASLAALKAAL